MVTKFGIVLSLIGLTLSFNLIAALPASAANSFNEQPQVSSSPQRDKSPNRGNGRRELYINIARFTIQ
ncbi:MAG TPA: hypothetical protein V6D15_09470 [Oculatellaceae cyanobacterium]|jgi:hypothetical protein